MRRLRFPHPIALLTGCILVGAALSYVLPAGQYERREDPVTGRSVVVPETYHVVESTPVGFFDALVAIPRGMADRADVIFLIFLIGGAFAVIDETGALRSGVAWLVARLRSREVLMIPVVSLAFATGGVIANMQDEIIALIPTLLILTSRLGFVPLTAVSMSAGAAMVGSAFSPINPFQVGIAQNLAEVPLFSGGLFRLASLVLALALWIFATMRHARRTRTAPEVMESQDEVVGSQDPDDGAIEGSHAAILALVLLTFGVMVYGIMRLGWDFDQMSAVFFMMGVVAGLVGGLRIRGTAEAYVRGFQSMAYAALLVGFAGGIFVVLDEGRIVDTIVHGLFTPLEGLPVAFATVGMMASHALVHLPVPSVSGQAVLTMPILVPLSDLLGLSRQVTVLAYQFGAGLCDLITPTNGALLAVLAAGGVEYQAWLKFALKWYLALMVLGAGVIFVAIAIGLQ